jgi:ribosomal protein S18 acetylase RimI-like enzyme
MAWDDVIGVRGVQSSPAPLETARFGHSVERVSAGDGASLDSVREAVLGSAADVVVLRYRAESVDWFAELGRLGRIAVFADSLAYWRLRAGTGRAPGASPEVRALSNVAPADVEGLIDDIFAGYRNHYLANPLFDRAKALAGYREWALRSVAAGGCVAVRACGAAEADMGSAPESGREGAETGLLGLATLEDTGPRTEILLAGVISAAQRRGVYAHVLKAVEDRTVARGGEEVVISTQGHNTRVQRAWARYGFEPVQTMLTVHLIAKSLLADG